MLQLKNHMEEIVKQYVDRRIPESDICTCEVCRMDIMAIMLNILKPQYVVTDAGALYAQLQEFDFQYKADLMMAMTKAIAAVKEKPRHAAGAKDS